MSPTRFGRQPLVDVMRRQRWTFSLLARELGCTYPQLHRAANGSVVPSPKLRDKLPVILATPLSELFTEEALSWRYHTTRPVGVHTIPRRSPRSRSGRKRKSAA